MKKANILALATVMMFSSAAFALKAKKKKRYSSSGQSTLQLQDATASEKKNKVDGDIDEEITNAKMRADSGSKSRFSLSTGLSYTGGSLAKPLDAKRPALSGEPGQQTRTSGNLDLSARYRWSKNDSVSLGTSFKLYTPFQGNTSKAGQKQYSVADPVLSYTRTGRLGSAIQTNGYVAASAGTSEESLSTNSLSSVFSQFTLLHGFKNGVTVGAAFFGAYTFYGNAAGTDPSMDPDDQWQYAGYGGDDRSLVNLGIFPFLEYSINDAFSLRTVFGYFNWRHIYGDPNDFRLLQTYIYQSVGLGISVTRDIYLYPNIQFVPDNIRSDFTNVAFSASMNIF